MSKRRLPPTPKTEDPDAPVVVTFTAHEVGMLYARVHLWLRDLEAPAETFVAIADKLYAAAAAVSPSPSWPPRPEFHPDALARRATAAEER